MAKQITLKPQDVVVALKIAVIGSQKITIALLADQLVLSASEVHACLKRAQQARLLMKGEEGIQVVRHAVLEFLVHGARYAFPGVLGGVTSGMPTAYAAAPLRSLMTQAEDLVPVWPHPNGKTRGVSLQPLYPTVPEAALTDERLYQVLALVDAMRIGTSRERELASGLLEERIA